MIDTKRFEKEHNGKKINLYTLKNAKGTAAQITNYGGRIVSLYTADRTQHFNDIVLGYDTIDGYFNSNEVYFGAIIGRYGNRIGNRSFVIDGVTYPLNNADENGNQLHGGKKGFHDVVWDVEKATETELVLSYLSVDGEEGFPGNVKMTITHVLTEEDELKMIAEATTDKTTHVNITYHSFFNLGGVENTLDTVLENELQINADAITAMNEISLPTGEILNVEGTPFDFRAAKTIGQDIEQENEQLKFGNGYDHNFIINGEGLRSAAVIKDPKTGRILELLTDEPGMQFYSTNFLNGSDTGKSNVQYNFREAFCLEPQHYPNTPNIPSFPSTLLKPGEVYKSTCVYKFDID